VKKIITKYLEIFRYSERILMKKIKLFIFAKINNKPKARAIALALNLFDKLEFSNLS